VGHVTKEGTIAGPRTMEHLVDVVLNFEGDRHSGFRMVRATKNRFGPADEVGCFEMAENGIVEVPDPSGLFTSAHSEPTPGCCLTVTMEGRRPLLAEIQALVAKSPIQHPRRITTGVENGRIAMLTAVLQRRAGLELLDKDIYASTVGGARIVDPAIDLACALALASAATSRVVEDRAGGSGLVAIGEVGLAGELRRVPGLERRLAEAARLGVDTAIVPAERGRQPQQRSVQRLRVIECTSLFEALLTALSIQTPD
jgi:DNA repair protein RadA/Sms